MKRPDKAFWRAGRHPRRGSLAHSRRSRDDDERYATAGARSVKRVALKAELDALLRGHDGKTLADDLAAKSVPCAPVLSVADALQHPHTAHREIVVTMGEGKDAYRGLGAPVKLSRTPATYRHPPLMPGDRFLEDGIVDEDWT